MCAGALAVPLLSHGRRGTARPITPTIKARPRTTTYQSGSFRYVVSTPAFSNTHGSVVGTGPVEADMEFEDEYGDDVAVEEVSTM